MIAMLRMFFKNLESYRIYTTLPKNTFNDLIEGNYVLKLIKKCPSHLALIVSSSKDQIPIYFVKLYQPRLFKRNRVKDFKANLDFLKKLAIPHLQPLVIIYHSPIKAIILRESFYGGIIHSYLSKGFLDEEDFLSNLSQGYRLIQNLVQFLYNLHQKKVLLRDTKYNNFYYKKLEGFKIFDIDGIKFLSREPSIKERLRDLAPLAMSLEWIGFKEATKIIFNEYQKAYTPLSQKAFTLFLRMVLERKSKREGRKTLLLGKK